MRSMLIIDDRAELLQELVAAIKERLGVGEAQVRTWVPTGNDKNPQATFGQAIHAGTTLVVTDEDLTEQGRSGLFGENIVGWCQSRALPVGVFSRKRDKMPREPNLFDFKIPSETGAAASYVVAVFRGFAKIDDALKAKPKLLERKSPASVLADLLAVPAEGNQFALYAVRLGATSGALMKRIVRTAPANEEPAVEEKVALLGYIVGHLLVNSVLRFPGPILSMAGLRAYIASDEADAADVSGLFTPAAYAGPFADLGPFFWTSKVDAILDELAAAVPGLETETSGEFNRQAVEKRVNRGLRRHECGRCHGLNGGFYCPFTERTVCQRADCSVGPNSWIPQGASVCRIERDFFEEWAPILGF